MMKRLKNQNRIIWKQLLLLPIIGGLFLLHSCADDTTNEVAEKIVSADDVVKEEAAPIAQALPRFPGCEDLAVDARDKCAQQKLLQYIAENIKYPEDAKSKSIEGTVISKFFVTTEGAIEDIKIVKPLGYGCDEEVVRVLEKMNGLHTWIPGTQEGKNVKVMFTLPVRFKLK
jgi:protein TonB